MGFQEWLCLSLQSLGRNGNGETEACCDRGISTSSLSRWWFQIFFIFIPTWGNDPIWLIFFRWVETTNYYSFGTIYKIIIVEYPVVIVILRCNFLGVVHFGIPSIPWWLCRYRMMYIYIYVGVSKNNGTPKSSILIGFSIINHPFWGFSPIFGNTHI